MLLLVSIVLFANRDWLGWGSDRALLYVRYDRDRQNEFVAGVVAPAELDQARLFALVDEALDRVVEQELVGVVTREHLPSLFQVH